MKKIVIAGGTGFLGSCLQKLYLEKGAQVTILTRGASTTKENIHYVHWDGKAVGCWVDVLENAEAVINLNGKSVDCRYTQKNKRLIYSTRLDATAAIGEAIQQCKKPPRIWINASSATLYRHSMDKEMDEYTGEAGIGFSVDVCQTWESTFKGFETPQTRKVVIRTAIVLGKNSGALMPLKTLAKIGLGGAQGPGDQYVSWLHENDFVNIVDFIIKNENMKGVYNLASPTPVTNRHIMGALRSAVGVPVGLPMPKWLLEFGAVLIRTETELILKSRRVVPRRLLEAGYKFQFDKIESALSDLC